MKHIKLFEQFINDERELNEFNLNLFGKFKKLLKNVKADKDDEFIDDIEILDPQTKKMIKLSSALSYDKKSKVRQIADMAMAELKDNTKDSKTIEPGQRVKYEFNKQLKARKAQSKEWGEEWTKDDENYLKTEIVVDQVNSLKGEDKKEFLKKALENADDTRFMMLDKRVDNEGAEQVYNSMGDVDKYLADTSGKGQNVTQTILRSKSATPVQREKALMYDWVASSNSAGALMTSKHMMQKLKMDKKSQDGFKYREESGENFTEKPGGKLTPDSEKANIKAVEDIYQKTQDYYKEKGIKTVKVYRGTDTENAGKEYQNPMESWTTDKSVAQQYGQYIQEKEIPVERVMMGHHDKTFPDPYDMNGNPSKEIVILGE